MQKQRGTKDSQETKRLLVVTYLKKKKGTHEQAVEMFQLSKSAVDKIWTRHKANFTQYDFCNFQQRPLTVYDNRRSIQQ
jgi:hypothetical protein